MTKVNKSKLSELEIFNLINKLAFDNCITYLDGTGNTNWNVDASFENLVELCKQYAKAVNHA